MIKIAKVDAYQGMDETDFKVMDQELDLLWSTRGEQEMTQQFFLEDESTIALIVYWDRKEVANIRFSNKGKLMDHTKELIVKEKEMNFKERVSFALERFDQLSDRRKRIIFIYLCSYIGEEKMDLLEIDLGMGEALAKQIDN